MLELLSLRLRLFVAGNFTRKVIEKTFRANDSKEIIFLDYVKILFFMKLGTLKVGMHLHFVKTIFLMSKCS